MGGKAWTPLRIAVLIAGALGTLFWLGALVVWWRIPNERRDGFELMGVLLATGYFIVLVLPTLLIALTGRWLMLGAALAVPVLVLASDTLWHWLPWW
jgi:hypothetical protein